EPQHQHGREGERGPAPQPSRRMPQIEPPATPAAGCERPCPHGRQMLLRPTRGQVEHGDEQKPNDRQSTTAPPCIRHTPLEQLHQLRAVLVAKVARKDDQRPAVQNYGKPIGNHGVPPRDARWRSTTRKIGMAWSARALKSGSYLRCVTTQRRTLSLRCGSA